MGETVSGVDGETDSAILLLTQPAAIAPAAGLVGYGARKVPGNVKIPPACA